MFLSFGRTKACPFVCGVEVEDTGRDEHSMRSQKVYLFFLTFTEVYDLFTVKSLSYMSSSLLFSLHVSWHNYAILLHLISTTTCVPSKQVSK